MSILLRVLLQKAVSTTGPIEYRSAIFFLSSRDNLSPSTVAGQEPGGASIVKKRQPYLLGLDYEDYENFPENSYMSTYAENITDNNFCCMLTTSSIVWIFCSRSISDQISERIFPGACSMMIYSEPTRFVGFTEEFQARTLGMGR